MAIEMSVDVIGDQGRFPSLKQRIRMSTNFLRALDVVQSQKAFEVVNAALPKAFGESQTVTVRDLRMAVREILLALSAANGAILSLFEVRLERNGVISGGRLISVPIQGVTWSIEAGFGQCVMQKNPHYDSERNIRFDAEVDVSQLDHVDTDVGRVEILRKTPKRTPEVASLKKLLDALESAPDATELRIVIG